MTALTQQSLVQRASSEVRTKNWEDAAGAYADLATSMEHEGRREEAHGAWAAAADAAYRGDRPLLAVRHLLRALELAPDQPFLGAMRRIQLASAFMELGDPESAAGFLDDAATDLEDRDAGELTRKLHVLLLDTRLGLMLMTGLSDRAAEVLEVLQEEIREGEEAVTWFRAGQIQRIRGHFPQAVESLSACVFRCRGDDRYDGPLGAALLEMAEVAILCGHQADAIGILNEAEQAWTRAGRRSGVFRVEAARMRALARSGACDMLPSGLTRAIEFAQEREMKVLEAELRLARGLCLLVKQPGGADEDLGTGLLLARHAAMPHLAGRFRLALHGRPGGRLNALEQARLELEENAPWSARALLAVAHHLATQPRYMGQALEMCGVALCQFSAMGMGDDEHAARDLMARLLEDA